MAGRGFKGSKTHYEEKNVLCRYWNDNGNGAASSTGEVSRGCIEEVAKKEGKDKRVAKEGGGEVLISRFSKVV